MPREGRSHSESRIEIKLSSLKEGTMLFRKVLLTIAVSTACACAGKSPSASTQETATSVAQQQPAAECAEGMTATENGCVSSPGQESTAHELSTTNNANDKCLCQLADTYQSSCTCGSGNNKRTVATTCNNHRNSRTGEICRQTCPSCVVVCNGGSTGPSCAGWP